MRSFAAPPQGASPQKRINARGDDSRDAHSDNSILKERNIDLAIGVNQGRAMLLKMADYA